jgi:integrase
MRMAKSKKPARERKRRGNNEGTEPYWSEVKQKWQCNISLGFGQNGQATRRTVYGNTEDECRQKRNQLLAQHGRGMTTNGNTVTLGAWLTRWLEMRRPYIEDSTYQSYKYTVEHFIPEQLRAMRLQALKRAQMRDLEIHLAKRDLSVSTRSRVFQYLRAAFEEAIEQELIFANPARGIRVKATNKEIQKRTDSSQKALTDLEMDMFLTAAEDHAMYPLFYTMFALGLRVSEALGLRWQDIDWTNGIVRIRQQVKRINGKLGVGVLKTPSSIADLPAEPDLLAILEQQRWQQDSIVQIGKDIVQIGKDSKQRLIFTTGTGNPISRDNVNRSIRNILEAINQPVFPIQIYKVTVLVQYHQQHEWVINSSDLARALKLHSATVRAYRDKYKEGLHWVRAEKNTRANGQFSVHWTKAGACALANPEIRVLLEQLKIPAKPTVTVRHFSSHACRHTNITARARDGLSADVVSKLARHSRISTTTDNYRSVFEDETQKAGFNILERRKRAK